MRGRAGLFPKATEHARLSPRTDGRLRKRSNDGEFLSKNDTGQGIPEQFRLSDGRDARELVYQVEALAEREVERTSHLSRLTWEDFVPPFMTGEFLRATEKLTENLGGDDRRKLLVVAEETWVEKPPSFPVQAVLRHWHDMESTASEGLTMGEAGRKGWAASASDFRRTWTLLTDRLRDGTSVTSTAEAFLSRAERLSALNEPAEAIKKAGTYDSEQGRTNLYWRLMIGRRYLGLNDSRER